MEIGNEISHKIRSAIKAKLVELGAYVDEELPDYIMVMVANKKSQFQMSEDLGLFLGTNTEKFTTWLHGLLQKLQSITSDSSSAIAAPSKEKLSEKTKSKEQCVPAAEDSSKPKKHVADEVKSKKHATDDVSEVKKESKRRRSDQEKNSLLDDAKSNSKVSSGAGKLDSDLDHSAVVIIETPIAAVSQTAAPANISSVKPIETKEVSKDTKKLDTLEMGTKDYGETGLDSDIQVVEDDDLSELLLTENDELTEELEQETAVVPPANKKSEPVRAAVIRIGDDEVSSEPPRGAASIIMSRVAYRDTSPHRSSRPKAVTSPIRQAVHRADFVRAVEPRPSELQTRKRRAPVSVIGSITHEIDSDDDDGYDPRNPAVGNVASVVRVTARKSSVPPKLQANKSLLLKAMTEAEKSVETQRRVAITPIKPFMRNEGREKDRDYDRPSRSAPSSSRDSGHASLRLAQTSLRQAITQSGSSRHSDPPVYIPTRKVQPAPRMDNSNRVGIVSKSKREEARQRAWPDEERETTPPRKFIKRENAAPIVNFVIEAELDTVTATSQPQPKPLPLPLKIKQEPLSPERNSPVPEPTVAKRPKKTGNATEIDSRVVEYEPEIVASPAEEKSPSESGSQGVPILLEDMDHDEFALDQDVVDLTESSSAVLEEDLRQTMMKEKTKDKTRFVVTLDGVDSEQYEMEVTESERFEQGVAMSDVQPSGVNRAPAAAGLSLPQLKEPLSALMSPPKIQPLNISLKDSDEEGEAMEVEPTPLKKAKMMERCKFWPACVNGAACDYHHPTVHCKTFPMCKFGEKCLYIHPNCRFDSKCVRPDCPYTHSSRRSIPLFQAPQIIPVYRPPAPQQFTLPSHSVNPPQCKFFPSCSNMSCPFFHPKPCRFGLACKNKGCPFYHPTLPTKDKLTWAARKDTMKTTLAPVSAAGAAK